MPVSKDPTSHELGSVPAELRGREVSCRVLGLVFDAARQQGLNVEELMVGSGYSSAHLASPGERISWTAFTVIMANAGRLWTDDQLRDIGASFFEHRLILAMRIAGRLLYTVPEFYLWAFGPAGPASSYFASVDASIREVSPGHIICDVYMRTGYAPSRENNLILQGVMRAVSAALGYEPAEVELEVFDGGVRFDIRVTDKGGLLGPIRRRFDWLFTARAAARHLQEAHEALHVRYLELQREVAARAEAEQGRRELLVQLERILDALPVGCIVHDALGSATYHNALTRRMFGARLDQGSVLDLIGLERNEVSGVIGRVLSGEQVDPVVRDGLDGAGRARRIEWWHTPLVGTDGAVVGLVSTFADATERERLEVRLSQVHRLEVVGRLAGGIAHDFNNLLTVILAGSEMVQQSLPQGDPRQEDLEHVKGAAARGAELTQQLLALGRRQPQCLVPLALDEVVANVLPMLRRLVRKDIELHVRPLVLPALVLADRAQVERVLVNLFVNACDAMPGPGKLTLETSVAHLDEEQVRARPDALVGRYVVLAVSDSGTGMDPETQARVFDPFFTTKATGTGLGLSIVYGLVRQGGGHLSVESEPGRGSTFKIWLPCIDAGGTSHNRAVLEPPGSGA